MSVHEKLATVQQKLKAPKAQRNDFGKYNYRSCEDILEAVKPILQEVGALLMVGDELIMIGDRYYVKATARFIDLEDGAEITNTAYAREEESKKGMDGSQVTGAASSYARKYALNGLLCIDDTKDADALNTSPEFTQKQPPKASQKEQTLNYKEWWAAIGQLGWDENMVKSRFPKDDLRNLTRERATEIFKELRQVTLHEG